MNIVFLIGIIAGICTLHTSSKPSKTFDGTPLTKITYPKIFWWVECRVACKNYMRCFPSWLTIEEMTFPPCGFDAFFANQSQHCQECLRENAFPTTITLTHPMLTAFDSNACEETTEMTVQPVASEQICQCRRVQTVKTITVESSCQKVRGKHGTCHLMQGEPQILTSDKSSCTCKEWPIVDEGDRGVEGKKKQKGKKGKNKKGKGVKSKGGKGGNDGGKYGQEGNDMSKGDSNWRADNGIA